MKRIAVFVYSLTIEYSLDALNGVANFYDDKNDVMYFIAQTKVPHCSEGLFEYHCWASAELLFSEQIDGYLIIASSYSSYISTERLSAHLMKIGHKPAVSVTVPLNLLNTYHFDTDCQAVYDEIVEHLKNKHQCKTIAFMSANSTKSPEAMARYKAFQNSMKKNKLTFNEELVMDGQFLKRGAIKAFKEKYKSKADINFDAMVCANDLMAVGVQETLIEYGVKVPEEVKIFGFDETSHAFAARPKISTVDQNIFLHGYHGAELLYKILCGEKCELVIKGSIIPLYRQSCGCVPLDNLEDIYCDNSGKVYHQTQSRLKHLMQNSGYFNFLTGIDNIYTLFDLARSDSTLQTSFYTMKYLMENAEMQSMGVFLFENEMKIGKNEHVVMPSKVRVSMYIDQETETELYEPGWVFDFSKKLYPTELFVNKKGSFIVQPIFSGENLYGYLICSPKARNFSIYSVYLKIIINVISQAYEYTKSTSKNQLLSEENKILQQNNSTLSTKSITDELTKVLNRRGVMELGQKSIDIAIQTKTDGLVIFFDMDGLKLINDTYGHDMGDCAIKSMAKIITKALRSNDIVGRLGGDEFVAVAVGIKENQVRMLRRRIKKLCEEETRKNKYPFNLSCSAGFTPFNSTYSDFSRLLLQSDALLYDEKKLKRAAALKNRLNKN